ncbi:MAG: hypothetical protein ACI4SD_02510 [Suilimivivens sp.]
MENITRRCRTYRIIFWRADRKGTTHKKTGEILENIKAAGIEITLPQLLFELIRLCMEGKAKQIGGNYFTRKMN